MLTFPHFEPHFARAHWTLPHVLEHQAHHRAQRPFLSWTDAGPALSYAEVNSRVNRLAHGMAAFGIGRREHVGILLPNCLEFLFAWFALNELPGITCSQVCRLVIIQSRQLNLPRLFKHSTPAGLKLTTDRI